MQSRRGFAQWVKTFELMYSMDGDNWATYTDANGDMVNWRFILTIFVYNQRVYKDTLDIEIMVLDIAR